MTTRKVSVCDRCGKRVDHRKNHNGWIHFDMCNAEVSQLHMGGYFEEKTGVDMDFCSFECMFDFFKEGIEPTGVVKEEMNPKGIHGEAL